VAEMPTAA